MVPSSASLSPQAYAIILDRQANNNTKTKKFPAAYPHSLEAHLCVQHFSVSSTSCGMVCMIGCMRMHATHYQKIYIPRYDYDRFKYGPKFTRHSTRFQYENLTKELNQLLFIPTYVEM